MIRITNFYFFISSIFFIFFFLYKFFSGTAITNIVILILIILINISYFLFSVENKKNFILFYLSSVFSVYFVNLILNVININSEPIDRDLREKIDWDTRTKKEYILDLKELIGDNVFPHFPGSGILQSNFFNNIENVNSLHPFSNIALSTIVHCNEYGTWKSFETDELGFNNPMQKNFSKNKFSISLIGDSFTEGFCHGNNKDIGSLLRQRNFNVMNFGRVGGLTFYEAVYREYIKKNQLIDSDFVIMNIYFVNDVNDTYDEQNSKILKQYIEDENFSQKLLENSDESQKLLQYFFEIIYQKDILENHPELVSYLQVEEVKKLDSANKNSKDVMFIFKKFIKLTMLRNMISPNLKIVKDKKRLEYFYNELDRIIKIITKKHKLIIVYLPSYTELFYELNNYSNQMEDFVNKKNNSDLYFINMNNVFKNYKIDSLFPKGIPGHYSEKGYGILANEIENMIN